MCSKLYHLVSYAYSVPVNFWRNSAKNSPAVPTAGPPKTKKRQRCLRRFFVSGGPAVGTADEFFALFPPVIPLLCLYCMCVLLCFLMYWLVPILYGLFRLVRYCSCRPLFSSHLCLSKLPVTAPIPSESSGRTGVIYYTTIAHLCWWHQSKVKCA
jgi:hypothetical protein